MVTLDDIGILVDCDLFKNLQTNRMWETTEFTNMMRYKKWGWERIGLKQG